MTWFLQNWRLAFVLALVAMIPLVYMKGYHAGKEAVRVKTITKVVEIEKEQNEIRNRRPDNDGLVDILRAGRF